MCVRDEIKHIQAVENNFSLALIQHVTPLIAINSVLIRQIHFLRAIDPLLMIYAISVSKTSIDKTLYSPSA